MIRQPTILTDLRRTNPLVHCITNIVVANFQANGLLALGASPIMADSLEEAADIAAISSCTLLNIGTLDSTTVDSMIAAGKGALQHERPLVLDPVGAGATSFRKQTVAKLLNKLDFTLIRGNAGEIAAIAGVAWNAKGVDAGSGDIDIVDAAKQVARQNDCIVAVTGETDLVTDGEQVIRISGGHKLMSLVTGSGCLLSAVAGAFLAVSHGNTLQTVAESLAFYKKSGEIAAEQSFGPGDFAMNFLNTLHSLNSEDVSDDQFKYEQEVIS
ncbi:hydroxyethylthiazole kinase [Sporosarcina sp. BI001-red]|uniref:hydroxyethylthiazole kinase n=1 Tax=Sporosarcina sp. BI001-red TaxID=2282866 RepID=UPI000E27BBC9|nr:hydroxyethylthiazole kinase [Sporosarcina sp. BI001-red]REB07970.1 hydroxyethylthiazole kinase [Sporosarcina sp. BI001-red]